MLDSVTLHRTAVARARRASAMHNPTHAQALAGSCVCHKCVALREDARMAAAHNGHTWTHVQDGIYCDECADWVIFREWEV